MSTHFLNFTHDTLREREPGCVLPCLPPQILPLEFLTLSGNNFLYLGSYAILPPFHRLESLNSLLGSQSVLATVVAHDESADLTFRREGIMREIDLG